MFWTCCFDVFGVLLFVFFGWLLGGDRGCNIAELCVFKWFLLCNFSVVWGHIWTLYLCVFACLFAGFACPRIYDVLVVLPRCSVSFFMVISCPKTYHVSLVVSPLTILVPPQRIIFFCFLLVTGMRPRLLIGTARDSFCLLPVPQPTIVFPHIHTHPYMSTMGMYGHS